MAGDTVGARLGLTHNESRSKHHPPTDASPPPLTSSSLDGLQDIYVRSEFDVSGKRGFPCGVDTLVKAA